MFYNRFWLSSYQTSNKFVKSQRRVGTFRHFIWYNFNQMLMKLCYNIIGNRVKIHFLHFTMVSSFMTNIYKYTLKFDNILPFIYWCLEFLFIECFALVPIYTCHYYWVSLTKTYQINTTHLISQSNKQPHVWSLIKFFLRVLDEVLCKLHSACYIGRSKWKTKVMTQFLFVSLSLSPVIC